MHLGSNPGRCEGNRAPEAPGKAQYSWVSEPASCNASESRAGLERQVVGRRSAYITGRPLRGRTIETHLFRIAGVLGSACREGPSTQRGRSVLGGRLRLPAPGKPAAQAEVGEAHGTEEPANHGGGTGPYFWVPTKEGRVRGLA